MTDTARRALTPVVITERHPSLRTGRREAWAAKSRDGRWFYKREERPGTPWVAEYLPAGVIVLEAANLAKARAGTASIDRVLVAAESGRECAA